MKALAEVARRIARAHSEYLARHTHHLNVRRREAIQSAIADLREAEHYALLAEAESKCALKTFFSK